jgi:hypothetical protein
MVAIKAYQLFSRGTSIVRVDRVARVCPSLFPGEIALRFGSRVLSLTMREVEILDVNNNPPRAHRRVTLLTDQRAKYFFCLCPNSRDAAEQAMIEVLAKSQRLP